MLPFANFARAEWAKTLEGAADVSHPVEGAVPRDPAAGWATFFLGTIICAYLYWRNHDLRHPMAFDEYNLLNTACILGIPLAYLLLFMRREPAEFGMTVGDSPTGLRYALGAFVLFLPVILISAAFPDAQAYYLWWMGDQGGSNTFVGAAWTGHVFLGGTIVPSRFAYHELAMGFYMFGWEFFFRGFLLNGFRRFLPLWPAILLQSAFFMAMHAGKPIPEFLSSFPGGVLMALLALRCRSFVPCFLLHFLISAGNDGAILFAHFHPYLPQALFALGAPRR